MSDLEDFETVAKAISDPGRLRILKMLEGGELCVCQITAVLGLATPTVSTHLAVLRRAGLLAQRRDGRWVHYRLAEGGGGAAADVMALVARSLNDDPVALHDREVLADVKATPIETLCAPVPAKSARARKKTAKEPA